MEETIKFSVYRNNCGILVISNVSRETIEDLAIIAKESLVVELPYEFRFSSSDEELRERVLTYIDNKLA